MESVIRKNRATNTDLQKKRIDNARNNKFQ
jgi:hypothetical protein